MKDKWYVDRYGVTRRHSVLWQRFWAGYMLVNGLVILAFLSVFIWGLFNIDERLPYMLLAQIPPLGMLLFRRILR